MSSKLPFVKPTIVDCSGLKVYGYHQFINKEEVGRGGFGAVFTAQLPSGEQCVIKKMLGKEEEDKRNFVKEARILQGLQHENIVGLRGICNAPFALVLEYVYFDFGPFGDSATKVSSMEDFLTCINKPTSMGFLTSRMLSTACKDVMNGLKHLHAMGVAHRDLKPANVLVSNQHYRNLTGQELANAFEERPLQCKLADFGESRSADIQTNTLVRSQTNNVNRGTPVYMAPEVYVEAIRLPSVGLEDLKRVDIWALGMLLFAILNPSTKYPYRQKIEDARAKGQTPMRCLEGLLLQKSFPGHQSSTNTGTPLTGTRYTRSQRPVPASSRAHDQASMT